MTKINSINGSIVLENLGKVASKTVFWMGRVIEFVIDSSKEAISSVSQYYHSQNIKNDNEDIQSFEASSQFILPLADELRSLEERVVAAVAAEKQKTKTEERQQRVFPMPLDDEPDEPLEDLGALRLNDNRDDDEDPDLDMDPDLVNNLFKNS